MAETEPAPETQTTPEATETPAPEVIETPPEVTETPPEVIETPAPEVTETPPEVEATDPEPGSPRRKRPRESAPSLVVPRLDASFWQQLVTESRATREASRRERFANLMRF